MHDRWMKVTYKRIVDENRMPSKWGAKKKEPSCYQSPSAYFPQDFPVRMLWMSPCSVVADKWCRFCCADVIQQPQGPTSPPVSVSWRMHSLCPVPDRWLVCVCVCACVCLCVCACVRAVVNVCPVISIDVEILRGGGILATRYSHVSPFLGYRRLNTFLYRSNEIYHHYSCSKGHYLH